MNNAIFDDHPTPNALGSGDEDAAPLVKQDGVESNGRSRLKFRAGPSGIHVFDRTTGLNLLLDEVRVPPARWATAPRQVSFALTNACDLSCPHCYAPKDAATLRVEMVTGWLDELDANGCLGVGFGGGEPTLYRHLPELCRYAARKTSLAVTFTTHAHRLDDRLASDLTGNVHFVRVSMDGVGQTYEMLRGRSFAALRRRLEVVRKLGRFGINFVVNRQTLPDLDAAIALAAEMGAAEFLLLPEQPTHSSAGIDSGTAQALCRWVRSYSAGMPLTVSETGADGLPTCNPFPQETGIHAYAHIDAAGVLKRSSYATDGVAIGVEGVMRALAMLAMHEENAQ
jgi:sulfatase maturation enzyme AslB (radical SAM superfamily)